MSRRSWKSAKFTDVQPRSSGNFSGHFHDIIKPISVALFMTEHGRIQMDFDEVGRMHLRPVMRRIYQIRQQTEAGFIFDYKNGLLNLPLSVEFEQARPKAGRRPLPEGTAEGQLGTPEGPTMEKCQIQTDCNNCFLMIKSRDQIFSLNGILKGNDVIWSDLYYN